MPIYEYKCEKCGKVGEFLVGVLQDKTDIKCKSCGSDLLKKILSSFVASRSSNAGNECASCDAGSRACGPGSCPYDD